MRFDRMRNLKSFQKTRIRDFGIYNSRFFRIRFDSLNPLEGLIQSDAAPVDSDHRLTTRNTKTLQNVPSTIRVAYKIIIVNSLSRGSYYCSAG